MKSPGVGVMQGEELLEYVEQIHACLGIFCVELEARTESTRKRHGIRPLDWIASGLAAHYAYGIVRCWKLRGMPFRRGQPHELARLLEARIRAATAEVLAEWEGR